MEKEISQEQTGLPMEYGKSPVSRLTWLYKRILELKIGHKPVVQYGITGAVFKSMLKNMTEIQCASLLMVHFNYRGKDKWLEKQLPLRAYPIQYFAKNVNVYIQYLIQDKGIEYSDLDSLKETVYKYVSGL